MTYSIKNTQIILKILSFSHFSLHILVISNLRITINRRYHFAYKALLLSRLMALSNNSKRFADEIALLGKPFFTGQKTARLFLLPQRIFLSQKKILFRVGIFALSVQGPCLCYFAQCLCFTRCLSYFSRERHKQPLPSPSSLAM